MTFVSGTVIDGRVEIPEDSLPEGSQVMVLTLEPGDLELLQDFLARQKTEQLAAQIDWAKMAQESPPPQEWFEGDEPKPF
jgi:hypothetical protein